MLEETKGNPMENRELNNNVFWLCILNLGNTFLPYCKNASKCEDTVEKSNATEKDQTSEGHFMHFVISCPRK